MKHRSPLMKAARTKVLGGVARTQPVGRARAIRTLIDTDEPLPERSAQRRPANRLRHWNSTRVEFGLQPSGDIPTECRYRLIRRMLRLLSRVRVPLLLRGPFGIQTRGERAGFVRINSACDRRLGLSSRLRHVPTISGSVWCNGGIFRLAKSNPEEMPVPHFRARLFRLASARSRTKSRVL
jgi:hypothetical protein